ncbi:MAG TPA: DUF2189 domain-containing protein [Amaricoccus sp.]|nr:DUF2189 domain-containing protein [uncultured Amaricoccus sp.]HRO10555.1 DUF2189 domain-containing protein [Amaricoccus sp.]
MSTASDAADPSAPRRPQVQKINADDVYAALRAGWEDFRATSRFGLFFGGVYAAVGILLFLLLWLLEQPLWIVPFAFAFPLIGPFAAIGLYEVSRRRETGAPLTWSDVLGVVWNERNRQIPSMAFIVLALFLLWMWVASMLVILFLGRMSGAVYSNLDALLATGNGIMLLVVGGLVGGLIAFLLFALTAVSLPLLLDRDVDYVTAMTVSLQAVTDNPHAMLHWAWIVVALLFVGMLPMFLGLIVALPVLGHATWHIYRKVIAPQA